MFTPRSLVKKTVTARGLTAAQTASMSEARWAQLFPDGRRTVSGSYDQPDFAGTLKSMKNNKHFTLQQVTGAGPSGLKGSLPRSLRDGLRPPLDPGASAAPVRQAAQGQAKPAPRRAAPRHLLGQPTKRSLYGFRGLTAMQMLRAGVPLPHIKEFLGHANIATTSIYASADNQMVREASRDSPAYPEFGIRRTRQQCSRR